MKKILLMLLLLAPPLWGGSSLPLELRPLTQQSGQIFVGICRGGSPELDERGFPSFWTRFVVIDAIKGVQPGELLWVKEYGEQGSLACRPGDSFLLFLYPESDYGFSSPIGLGQGRFPIRTDPSGRRWATTPFPHLAAEIGKRDLETLIGILRDWIRHEK